MMAIQFNSFKKNSNNHAMLLAAHMNCLVKKIKIAPYLKIVLAISAQTKETKIIFFLKKILL